MEYSHGVNSFGMSIPLGTRQEITTTRVRDDIQTTLTNINTKSDAWGKVIPMGFGRHRVAGALVWASQFYKTLESFDDVTTQKSIVTYLDHQDVFEHDSVYGDKNYVVNTQYDAVRNSGSQVTHGSTENAYIDLCYSVGTEGDPRKKRYIEKIRVNTDTLIYDASATPPFIMDGIGFSVRYGYDDAAPDLMAKYPNGIFHYKDQTLIIFDRFPLALFGNSVPNSVDAEWGCCVGGPVLPCQFQLEYNYYGSGNVTYFKYDPPNGYPTKFVTGQLLIMYSPETSGPGKGNFADFTMIQGSGFSHGGLTLKVGALVMTDALASSFNGGSRVMNTAGGLGVYTAVFTQGNGEPFPLFAFQSQKFEYIAPGQSPVSENAEHNGWAVILFYDPVTGGASDYSKIAFSGQKLNANIETLQAPENGWIMFSALVANPCISIG